MNDSDTQMETSSKTGVSELQQEVRSLRAVLTGALVALILLSGCLNIYLKHQATIVVRQAGETQKFVADYYNIGAPSARDLWHRLTEYAKTHPNFNPIIAKYSPYILARPATKK